MPKGGEAAYNRDKKKLNDLQYLHWPQECKTFAALQRPLVAPMHKHIHMSIRSDPHFSKYPSDPHRADARRDFNTPHPINPCMDSPHLLIRRWAVASDRDADAADAAASAVQVTSQAHTAPPALSPPATLPPSRLRARARPVRRPLRLLETRLLPCRLCTPHLCIALTLLPRFPLTHPLSLTPSAPHLSAPHRGGGGVARVSIAGRQARDIPHDSDQRPPLGCAPSTSAAPPRRAPRQVRPLAGLA